MTSRPWQTRLSQSENKLKTVPGGHAEFDSLTVVMKNKCDEHVFRLDVPHYFDKEDQRVEDYYTNTTFAHLMCVRCGFEQQTNLDSDVITRMLGGVLLHDEMLVEL